MRSPLAGSLRRPKSRFPIFLTFVVFFSALVKNSFVCYNFCHFNYLESKHLKHD